MVTAETGWTKTLREPDNDALRTGPGCGETHSTAHLDLGPAPRHFAPAASRGSPGAGPGRTRHACPFVRRKDPQHHHRWPAGRPGFDPGRTVWRKLKR